MSDTPKFEVIDRRKMKAEEERESGATATEAAPPEKPVAAAQADAARGPRLVVSEQATDAQISAGERRTEEDLPPAPTAEETRKSKAAYDVSAQRVEEVIRAQNPTAGPQPPVSFDHLVQQFYLSAMLQMGAGTQEGQRPRVDIVGARATIDLLGVLTEKTKGNLTDAEDRMLQSVLFELRMTFMELTSMVTVPNVPPTPRGK
jgi:hypothetical protein